MTFDCAFASEHEPRNARAASAATRRQHGGSYHNALAESVIGLYKTEETYRRGPRKGIEDVEFATLEWVAWYNTRRLLEPLGYASRDECEQACYRHHSASAELATVT